MKLYFLCLSALTVGALCKIDDVCIVQSGKNGVEGKCQKKSECMKAGLATFSKSGRSDVSGTFEELACPGDDEEVQCCVEIKCGSHTCRNNVESNPCAEGAYVANFRDRALCPSSSLEDNVQCCVENSHNGLKRRQGWKDYDRFGARPIRGSAYDLMSNGGLRFASAEGVIHTIQNNAPSVGEGIAPIVPITPFGGSGPTSDINVAGPSVDTIGALPNTPGTSVPAVSNTAVDLGGLPAPPDTSASITPTTPNTDLALGGTTSNSNFNLAQVDNYSQSAQGTTQSPSTPNEGVSFGLNSGLRPQLTYTNQGGSTFSVGPTTSVPSMIENIGDLGSTFNGVQGGINMGFRKLKRSLADKFN